MIPEIVLDHPFEYRGVRYERLALHRVDELQARHAKDIRRGVAFLLNVPLGVVDELAVVDFDKITAALVSDTEKEFG